MRYASRVKPISFVKANAAELLADLAVSREPLAITQNGEVTAILQDVASFEATQDMLALLKLLALGTRDIEAGRTRPLADVIGAIGADSEQA